MLKMFTDPRFKLATRFCHLLPIYILLTLYCFQADKATFYIFSFISKECRAFGSKKTFDNLTENSKGAFKRQ